MMSESSITYCMKGAVKSRREQENVLKNSRSSKALLAISSSTDIAADAEQFSPFTLISG